MTDYEDDPVICAGRHDQHVSFGRMLGQGRQGAVPMQAYA